MTENVQCPVCTLYLHAGMNLSDHLETHPKEQVIRALVQMTISANSNNNNKTLASNLTGESSSDNVNKKTSTDLEEKPLSCIKDNELNIGSPGNSSSYTSTNSLTSQSVNNSQTSNNVLNFSDTKIERLNENEQEEITKSSSILSAQAVVKAETTNTAVAANENMSQCFSKQNFEQTNLSENSKTRASHSHHQNSIELTNVTNNIHNNFNVFECNTRYEQQLRNGVNNQNQTSTLPHMPPPPPPATAPSQTQHHVQHQEVAGRGISPVGPSGTFHSMQPQALPPPHSPHHTSLHFGNSSNSLRQAHMFTAGQHQQPPTNSHHTQSLKVIYTPNLPPPPPLQLFTYQPQSHLQHHQKPPPAYGTAISQIRSQHNQSKHQIAGSLATQHQHQTLQSHSVLTQQQQQQQHNLQQQQILEHNLRIQVPPPPPQPQLSIPAKHTCSPKISELPNQNNASSSKHSQPQQHQQQSKADLSQHQQHQSQLQELQQQTQPQTSLENTHNANTHICNSNKSLSKGTSSAISQNSNTNQNVPSYPQVSISPSTNSSSMAAIAASTLGRHTNSPFAALLAAAAGAPSPSNTSSVLRYAESPVAHYLERDNGDFIVQETPKHIVECVETDNGDFSVIERIYQSPPSVLHIHDDDDDDDDDDNADDDNNCEGMTVDEQRKNADVKYEQNVANDTEREKNEDELDEKRNKTSSKDVKTSKTKPKAKTNDQTSVDNEIVDFVSISSDSSDEEEFISQEQKDHTNIDEKNKPSLMSAISTHSSSTSSTTLPVAPALITTASGDHQPTTTFSPFVTANTISTQQNFAASATNSTSSRKKSSKNTITVLSDVQLNLNEYLDLVGNIIASSKVAAQRKILTSAAPIPLVKIEKEEPMDEYITSATPTSITTPTASPGATTTLTNFKPAPTPTPPMKANKLETEEITDTPNNSYNKQTTNNHNIVLATNEEQDEQEDKKPQVFGSASENETALSIAISNAPATTLMTANSSYVTSVIRMATTSQHQLQQQQQQQQDQVVTSLENCKNFNEAEDLSQRQQKVQSVTNSKTLVHTPLARKGPKKLIIKPKSTKTEALPTTTITAIKRNQNQTNNDQEMPITSVKAALQDYKKEEETLNTADIEVKNEPITSITYENLQQQQRTQYQPSTSFSILEQHLSSKEPILEFKEEKPCITEASLPSTSIIKEMKIENNVNDDARVLYNFANSKKSLIEVSSTFPSSTSLFSTNQTSTELTSVVEPQHQQHSKNINPENEASSSTSSSTYSSQSVMDASMPPEEHNESSTTNASAAATTKTQHHTNQIYSDFHFNYLYNSDCNNVTPVVAEETEIKNHQQYTSFYQNSTNSTNNTLLLEDSSSSKHYTDYQQLQHNHHHLQQQQQQAAGTSHDQWYNSSNYQTSETNVTPIMSNHSVDGTSVALDSSEGSKYLDLDSCKREQNVDIVGDRVTVPAPPPPSSSTSCSFNGTTDNSMAGICSTTVALNIRTDEKMPAKGEISEQESNCDIDNSWSQPMYGDISARFFKTTFPGIFPQDNGWNHEEYFAVQDLSASTTTEASNNANTKLKSFESNNSSNNISSNGMPIFSQNSNDNCNIDVMPSTSSKIRKRRKRISQDGRTSQTNGKRMQPTSTVTSQQMLMQHQNEVAEGVDFSFHPQQQQHHLQQPSTSTAFLPGPANTGTALAAGFIMEQQRPPQLNQQTQQKQRTKVYECGHCNAKYSKLKDRNAHLIDVHNYIRQNRRLVCLTTGVATSLNNSDMQDVALPTTSAAGSMLVPALQSGVDCLGDYKQDIVKIENENPQRGGDQPGVESVTANLSAKTEIMEDDKQSIALANVETTLGYDTKLPSSNFPLSMTTSTSKLTTLYRMLVSFNMTTLKANQSLSEIDENLIKSSIFFCYICRQNYNSVKMYDAHLTEHPAECFTCGKKFQRWKNFSLHLKRHLGWKEFGCTVCDKKFVVRSALVEHVRMHSGLSPLKCKVCGKHFKRYSNLTQHRKRHTKQIVRRKEYVCYCGEVLPSKARFLWHKETHDSKPKCCPHCCDRFVHVNSLRRHIRLAHSDKFDYTEPMECPICKQIFAKASMKAHMATHSTETQYDCIICNKSFSTKWNLKIHSWVHANRTAKPFKCEHCPKAFVREIDFKNHMNSHKQIKPYTCEVCGCKFIRKYNYMRHRREHHGNKKYTCDLCKKSFHRHYYLIEHRRIHTGERPFQCSICGKSSTTKTNHNKHLKIHHSRDPFTVEV